MKSAICFCVVHDAVGNNGKCQNVFFLFFLKTLFLIQDTDLSQKHAKTGFAFDSFDSSLCFFCACLCGFAALLNCYECFWLVWTVYIWTLFVFLCELSIRTSKLMWWLFTFSHIHGVFGPICPKILLGDGNHAGVQPGALGHWKVSALLHSWRSSKGQPAHFDHTHF